MTTITAGLYVSTTGITHRIGCRALVATRGWVPAPDADADRRHLLGARVCKVCGPPGEPEDIPTASNVIPIRGRKR